MICPNFGNDLSSYPPPFLMGAPGSTSSNRPKFSRRRPRLNVISAPKLPCFSGIKKILAFGLPAPGIK